MKYILIPTDFSDSANYASEFGIQIAKLLELPLRFLHSIQTPVDWSKLNRQDENKYPESKARINSAKEQLKIWEKKAEEKEVEAEHTLLFNTGMEELNSYVNPEKYELVIMGTHGTKGFEKILGSNTQKLIRQSKVPVLAIKYQFDISNFKKILIATDLKEESQNAFKKVYKFLEKLKTEVELVYINTPYNFRETDQIDNMAAEFLAKIEIKELNVQCLNANNEARGIGMALNKLKPDLFTSITHQRSGLDTIFSPSTTEEIINNYDLPVLSINRDL
ncbi:universal stress protein [Salegentibacter salegens]|uniref:Nucleotide-binding universal stress protein, UspA family n=1 Tax=Salegentibacter salegens TaxID=143223 RepID=A0A1M7NA05_9FLAO|nr:universal stress protein [Salegentibacter salegens]PRX40643.1 nucleotide-binding universal stress UspA family protein [Salegentibacter salegens]SHN00330.1 Nucleotide-binding universal stress protein, UspA family [Salegentibacter salegens]